MRHCMAAIRQSLMASVVLMVVPFWSGAAHAQQAAGQGALNRSPAVGADGQAQADEIVVTAQKREQRLMDVPISISAYSQEALDKRGIKDISDVAAATPGLNFGSTGVYNRVTIRGISTGARGGSQGVGSSTTAIYVDDIPIQARPIGGGAGVYTSATPKIFDLERVEVLRGPQGTLFGGGALGGAVRFITPEPNLKEFTGYARAEMSDTSGGGISNEAGVAVGGPIVEDKLGFRVSGWHRRDGGYIDHLSLIPGGVRQRNADKADSYVGRAALTFKPSESIRITPSIYAQDVHSYDLGTFSALDSDADDGKFLVTTPLLSPVRDKFFIPSLRMQADFSGVTATSITTYFHRNHQTDTDYTFVLPLSLSGSLPTSLDQYQITHIDTRQRNFTQELRLSASEPSARLQWTIGGFYNRAKTTGFQTIESPRIGDYIPGVVLLPGGLSYRATAPVTNTELAGYANFEYRFFDTLSVIAGVRVSRLKEDFHIITEGPLGGGFVEINGKQRETAVTPKFGINFKPDPDNLFYVSAAKGFRPGGVNKALPTISSACAAATAALGASNLGDYQSDSLWSYEVGSKNSLMGGRLNLSFSAYHIKWKNIQSSVRVPQCLGAFVANFGDAKSDGFDLAVDARLTKNLLAGLSVGYTRAVYTNDNISGGRIYTHSGDQIADIPPWNIVASLQYNFELTENVQGYGRIENRYQSRNKGNLTLLDPTNANFDPAVRRNESVNQLNLRAGVLYGGLDLSVFVNNVLNDHPLLNVYFSRITADYGASTIRPRTLGVSATYRW
ncbi:Outer membrane receptor proteins, mostly Fe transport [Novosphingobium mathurense]|uniref:Outer membrane receptor proteins, mostly Fe transport n=2 Tax=Novosphingobium mathurense TaxID=428990 RepID=A0A1U6IL60_9SPHN|nr:Outer membrane receptor proteins, mostly Fe transport [Novosphingobium mathurense]